MKLRIYQTIHRWALRRLRRELKSLHKYEHNGVISDHAILRHFERIQGYDVELLRSQLLSDKVRKLIREYGGNGKFTVDGVTFVCVNNCVVTLYAHEPGRPVSVRVTETGDKIRRWSF